MLMGTPTVTRITGREVLDCRGLPTVQVDVALDSGVLGRADVPAGRSTGRREAKELRDGGHRYRGLGVAGAVGNVRGPIAEALVGTAIGSIHEADDLLRALDGTTDKSKLGANAICGVSLAVARALAAHHGLPLYRFLAAGAHVLPTPQVNLINGGLHASNDLDFQEFIVMPVGAPSMAEALRMSTEINLALGEILVERYGKAAVNVGDEGGYAPPVSDPEEALALLHEAVEGSGYEGMVRYGLDCAASHFYDASSSTYRVAGADYDRDALIGLYADLAARFDVVSIEDPLHEDDAEGFAEVTRRLGIQIVGDDFLVTDPARVDEASRRGSASALLLKVNQIGTLTEALAAADAAHRGGMAVVVSERSGETEDAMIADLSVALGAGQIKTGAPVRGERTAKYNRLLQIEEELGTAARYAGAGAVRPRLS